MAVVFLILHLFVKTRNPLFAIISGVLFIILGGISLLGELTVVTGSTANITWVGDNASVITNYVEAPVTGLITYLGIIWILTSIGILTSAWIERNDNRGKK